MKKLLVILAVLIMAVSVNAADMYWDASTGDVGGYRIYYGLSSGDYTQNQDVGNVLTYPMDNLILAEGVLYYFVVRAYNSAGESGNSNEVSYTLPIVVPPVISPPINVAYADGLITWEEPEGVDGYRIYYVIDGIAGIAEISAGTTQFFAGTFDCDVEVEFYMVSVLDGDVSEPTETLDITVPCGIPVPGIPPNIRIE